MSFSIGVNSEGIKIIEQDALTSTPETAPIAPHDHPHEEVKSFVAQPQAMTRSLVEKALSWIKGDRDPNAPIVYKSADGLRHMLLITSNSYKDRDGETITSKALEEYEASCYPGEGLYHNENPLLWWHDNEIVMGTIEGVEYIAPFLFESAREIPNDPISKALWDYAEANGDNAGTSHRFGYLEKDRDPDGTFHRIFKQETSYLPERSLAANDRTYAGVITSMSIPESRKRLGKILKEATGLDDLEELIHTDVGAAKKRLAELGVSHKAVVKPVGAPPAVVPAADDEVMVETEDVEIEEDAKDDMPVQDGKADLGRLMVLMNGMLNMFQDMMDTQVADTEGRMALAKAFDELKELRVSEKAQESVTLQALETKIKSLESEMAGLKARLSLTPKRAADQTPLDPKAVANAVSAAEKAREQGEMINDPFWGPLKKLQGE